VVFEGYSVAANLSNRHAEIVQILFDAATVSTTVIGNSNPINSGGGILSLETTTR
jgi:hypothetical protein